MVCFIFCRTQYLLILALFINIKQTISPLILLTSAHIWEVGLNSPFRAHKTDLACVCIQPRQVIEANSINW